MTPPLFLVPSETLAEPGGSIRLEGPEGRHAVRVRRLGVGETVEVSDGEGARARCTVAAVGKDTAELAVQSLRREPPVSPRLILVQALPKGDRGDLAVEVLTEVGVDVIVPWAASRCVTQWRGPRGDKALERWRATAREAAKQARRTRVPTVEPLASTAGLRRVIEGAAAALVLHEEAASPLAGAAIPSQGDVVLVVGPEGGMSDDERAVLAGFGATAVRLGPTVLRTSTAGVVACAVVLGQSRWQERLNAP